MTCPCGSGETYENCCGQYHAGKVSAPTAETLMRSRYSAFVKAEIEYLKETTWPAQQKHFDEAGYETRAKTSIWLGLEILQTEEGSEADTKGTVTFNAKSMINGTLDEHKEKSLFKKKGGKWFYVKAIG